MVQIVNDSGIAAHAKRTLNPHYLELIILPTERCNFRCVYCYEDFAIGRMKPEIIQSIKNLVDERTRDLSVLKIAWFGGEPLAAPDIVSDLTSYIRDKCAANNVRFISDMTTNAYRLELTLFKKLVDLGITSYQVTLDGLKDSHDITRPLASGGGTFDQIWANLIAMQDTDLEFSITVRLHVTRQNIDTIEAAHAEIQRTFGSDRRFSIFIKAIENLGGAKTAADAVPNKDKMTELETRFAVLAAHSVTLEDGYICYAARPNSFVIRADGTIAKCTVAFKSDANDLGKIKPNGGMELNVEKLRRWFKGYETLDKDELCCPVSALGLWN